MTKIRSYEGRCHCGAVRFRFESEEITTGIRCNCSMCVRKGAVMSDRYFTPAEIDVEGKDALTLYLWGDKLVNQWFCRTCGIYPFHDVVEKPGHFRVNLGCVDDIDPFALQIKLIDGKSY